MRDSKGSKIFGQVTASAVLVMAAWAAAVILIVAIGLTVAPREVEATPTFANQTCLPCGQCHENPAGGGKLKPFGQRFKDNGYKVK